MGLCNWLIVLLPMAFIIFMSFYCRRYIRDVVDFLSAGRVARRYVVCVCTMEEGLGLIGIVGTMERLYATGLAVTFWNDLIMPVSITMSLFGYCYYRFRETKSLTQGQFLEMRYNKALRVFAETIRVLAEFLTEVMGPAIAGRFFIYLLDFPATFQLLGITWDTYGVLMAITMIMAVTIIWTGGELSLAITDCIQGLFCYPMFVLICGFILFTFSWHQEVSPVMLDRVPGESMLNPFDISKLRDFNLFAFVVTLTNSVLNRVSWNGGSHDTTAISPHEQKMASLLGAWRSGMSAVMYTLIAVGIITMMSHQNFKDPAQKTRQALSVKVSSEIAKDEATYQELTQRFALIPPQVHVIGQDAPLSRTQNLDNAYLDTAHEIFVKHAESEAMGHAQFQQFRTLYYQLLFPVSVRHLFPRWMLGFFCLMLAMMMVSTDDSRIFKIACTTAQDMVLPFMKKAPTAKTQMWLVRWLSLATAVIFWICSLFMSQIDYLSMFISVMSSVWTGGAGTVMVFGLYSRFGTSAGAFAALISSGTFSTILILIQRNWAAKVYPWLEAHHWVDGVATFLETCSRPFHPYIVWNMDKVKFPINGYEIFFMSVIIGLFSYILFSLITYKKPFNLEKMLHRGQWDETGRKSQLQFQWSLKTFWKKIIGITPEYTKGDRIIAYAVFGYSLVYRFGLAFLGVVIWNLIDPWGKRGWGNYYFICTVLLPGIVGFISTFWFLIGGYLDLKQMFKDLAARKINYNDNGMVEKIED